MPESLVFLLPRFDPKSAEHFFHLYGFLERVAAQADLTVVVERMRPGEAWAGRVRVRRLHARFAALRFFEELAWFATARVRGARRFYIHYSFSGGLAASLVTRLMGGETYYWNCGLYRQFAPGREASWRERWLAARGICLLEMILRLCTWLVTGTPRMAEYYAREAHIPLTKIRVLPNFVDQKRFAGLDRDRARQQLGIGRDERVLLFLHRVAPRKGAHHLPAILSAVEEGCGPVRLIVAGDGPYLASLREVMERTGLSGRCDFRGWVPNRDAPAYFRAADLYLMPSLEEGFPHVLLEAMASACPFVAFDLGGMSDILTRGQAAEVVRAGAVDEFARRCVELVRDQGLRQRLAAAGLERVKVFDEERVADMFVEMMRGKAPPWPGASTSGGAP